MINKGSILDYIKEHMVDGQLPNNFSLPAKAQEGIAFADGAMDGITMYHMGAAGLQEKDIADCMDGLHMASEGKHEEAEKVFRKICDEYRVIAIIDDIQRCIARSHSNLDPDQLYSFAEKLIMTSDNTELVKLGLAILELFNVNESLKETVRILGLSDEFTFFSVFHMKEWENGNMEILELAKKVSGWGRIHAIDNIEPENEEIKNWLLQEGIHNTVLPAYSALNCYVKADVEELLNKETLSYEEFHAIAEIMDALLDEGPVSGISELENGQSIIYKFLEHAKKMNLSDRDKIILQNITEWNEKNCN